jgi:RecA/RadA recombinase
MAQNSNKWLSMMLKDEKNLQGSLVVEKDRVLTASPSLNWALSGGFYRGYTTCVYGPEGAGKSLVSMMAVGALQQTDPEAMAVIISTEMRAPSASRMRQLGVDPDRVIIRQVNTLHDVFDWIASKDEKFKNSDGTAKAPGLQYMLIEGAPIKALIIDSIKGIQGPKEQAAETVEKDFMGDISKFLNPSLRAILPIIREYNLMTIFVQQVNMNMNPDEVKWQNKIYTIPSGQALKHFCETMALVTKVESKDSKIFDDTMHSIRELPVQVGHTVRVKVEKANLDSPFREAEFQVAYKQGIVNKGMEIAKLAVNLNIITHPLNDKGAPIAAQWLFGTKKWIGFANAVKEIEKDLGLQDQLMEAIDSADVKPVVKSDEQQ